MAISINKYIKINSTFPIAGSKGRTYGGLVFTATEMLSAAEFKDMYDNGEVVMLDLKGVKDSFGGASKEFAFATGYYGYISPTGKTASTLSFCKVRNQVKFEPAEYAEGKKLDKGAIVSHLGNYFQAKENISADANLGWNEVFEKFVKVERYAAEVAYEVDDSVLVDDGIWTCKTQLDEETNVDWDTAEAFFDKRVSSVTPASAFLDVIAKTNRFGSFTFLDTATRHFTEDELREVATVNSGLDTRFLLSVDDVRGTKTPGEVVETKSPYGGIKGCVFISGKNELSGYMPMAIFASTNYDTGPVTCQMFKQFGTEIPTVINDFDYELFKSANVNFYGRTQSNGETIDFYQRGFNTDGTDTAVYCNEVWFKSTCYTKLMGLLKGVERVPANQDGVNMVENAVRSVCIKAKNNGTFMSKILSEDARLEVIQQLIAQGVDSAKADAVVNDIGLSGYSIITSLLQDSSGEYMIHYYVFYGTADSIRFIEGDNVLIK